MNMQFSDFGFKENPFAITPDPRYLFLSRGHEESLAHLIYGTGPNGGFVQLTGEVGTGKTMLVRSLLAQKLENVDIALILNPRLSRREFIAAICDELGVVYQGPPYHLKQLSDDLIRHLLKTHAEGRHTVVLVDEAQNLSPRVLEQVRLLTNLETSRHKLLRIILVGQPELQQMLARKELRQVDQRITARYHLYPLSRKETADYIRHRLAVAGVQGDLFTPSALRLIHRLSGGVPRRVNTLCERALLAIFATDAKRVGIKLAWRAAREIEGQYSGRGSTRWVLAGVLLLVTGLGAWWLLPAIQADRADARVADVETQSMQPVVQTAQEDVLLAGEATAPGHLSPGHGGRSRLPDSLDTTPSLGGGNAEALQEQTLPASAALARLTHKDVGNAGSVGNMNRPSAVDPEKSEQTEPAKPLEVTALTPVSSLPPALEALPVAATPAPPRQLTLEQRLFSLWGKEFNPESGETLCIQAMAQQLRCLRGHTNWDGLRRMNRPALLSLKSDQGQRLLLLKGLQGERLQVVDGAGERQVDRGEIAPAWNGKFLMLWRPAGGMALVGPGSTGKAVTWLRQRLAQEDGEAPPLVIGLDHFDGELMQKLQSFQQSHGLQADGVAGQQTLLYLNNLQLPQGTPTLTGGG